MFSQTTLTLPSRIRNFSQWCLALLAFVLLCNMMFAPQPVLAQSIVRISIVPGMSLDEIRTELSRYFTPEIESETYRYKFDSVHVQMTEIGPIIGNVFGPTSAQIVFLMPVDFSSRTQPVTEDCGVSVAPYYDGEYVGLLWQISCGSEYYKIFHPLPDPVP